MQFNTQKTLAFVLPTALLFVGGCEMSNGMRRTTPAQPTIATGEDQSFDQTTQELPKRYTLNDRGFGDPTDVSFANQTPKRQPKRSSTFGLYGELVNYAPKTAAPVDGSHNIVQVSFATEGLITDPDVDATGQRITYASTTHNTNEDIFLKSAYGSTQTQLTSDPARDVMPTFSPDGKFIAFASDRAGSWNIFIMPSGGGRATQLTHDYDPELHPTWSPDGRSVAYCKRNSQSGRWEIWTIEVENPGVRHMLVDGMFPQWNPDPARPKILFQRPRQRGSRFHSIWTIDFVNGEASSPTEIASAANAAVINPCWSPDGSRIAFISVLDPDANMDDRPMQSDVWIVGLDGGNRTNITNGQYMNVHPVWSSNGNIYFVSDRSGVDNLWAASTGSMMTQPQYQPHEIVGADENSERPDDQP